MFFKVGVLKNFTYFTKKACVGVSFYFEKFAFLKRPATLLKKDSNTVAFL